MLKIENMEFGSYELNPNDYFFDITPNMVAMMQLVVEGADNKKQYVYIPNEDFTLIDGVTTNTVMKALVDGDRNEYERLMDKVRSKLKN